MAPAWGKFKFVQDSGCVTCFIGAVRTKLLRQTEIVSKTDRATWW